MKGAATRAGCSGGPVAQAAPYSVGGSGPCYESTGRSGVKRSATEGSTPAIPSRSYLFFDLLAEEPAPAVLGGGFRSFTFFEPEP
jgi:hypothetical protein